MLTTSSATGDSHRCYCCCSQRPGYLCAQTWSPGSLPRSVNFTRDSVETSVCGMRRKPATVTCQPPPPPAVPRVPECVHTLARYMHKLHQKAFVYTFFIHFQRVKQPIYWAVNTPRPASRRKPRPVLCGLGPCLGWPVPVTVM